MVLKGKLIVIEGLDGSGKGTQAPLLTEYLKNKGHKVKELSFPCYDSESSALIKMYLSGEMGMNVNDVNAYAASVFYTVDRYASFKTSWEKDYSDGCIMVANRYTTSNIVHQMGKLPKENWDEYIEWLEENEYVKMGIPKPDLVIFLDVPVEVSQKLLSNRYSGDENKKDIHEMDVDYLKHCHDTVSYAAKKCNWTVIECTENGEMLSIDDIHNKITEKTKGLF